ncbi:Scn11a [Symbiodinium sp. CCMP2456]|nr:Scn11a [Symbiodinium sp. CCMP2456]
MMHHLNRPPLPSKAQAIRMMNDELSMSEASSSAATSGECKSSPSLSKDDKPRRVPSPRGKDKKPTLFSTFTQHDLALRQEATEVAASQSAQVSDNGSEEERPSWVFRVVNHHWFDAFFSAVVITNSIFIGIDVELNPSAMGSRSSVIVVIQYIYTLLFFIELVFRSAALGRDYYCSKEWMWAALDVFIVATSLWEVFVDTWYAIAGDEAGLESFGGLTGLKAFRIVRITRIVKTVRLMRIFRFVLALRTLIHSIWHTLKSLFWALVLLLLIVYIFGMIFTQAVNGHIFDPDSSGVSDEETDISLQYYGKLTITMLSLFMSVTDGISWEKINRPLADISPFLSLLFLFYIAFTYFAVLNVLTAVFCQSAIESAQNDHATAVQSMLANKEMHLQKIRALFSQLGSQQSGTITFGQFEEKINSAEVREYFETLGLDVEDAWSFFKLLDQDGGGSVEVEEFLRGCLRFRGNAKAIDIGQLLHDQSWLIRHQSRFHTYMEMELQKLMKQIASLSTLMNSPADGTPRRNRKRTEEEKSLKAAAAAAEKSRETADV